jgi:hypothetical protein
MRSTASRSSSTSSSESSASADPRRRAAAVGLGALVAVALAVLLVVLLRGGGDADPLARLAPADALGWVHVDPRADDGTWALAGRFPALRDLPEHLAAAYGLNASELDLARDVRPWVGDDAGLAWLPDGRPLLIASVANHAGAEAALRRLGARPAARGVYTLPAPGAIAGLTDDRLALGPDAVVRAALARADGKGGDGLAGTPAYEQAMRSRGGDAPLALYAPAAGVQRLIGGASGLLSTAAALLNSASLTGVAAEVAPAEGGAEVHARLLRRDGTPAPAAFGPSLLSRVPLDGTAALLDLPSASLLEALAVRLGASGVIPAIQTAVGDEVSVDLERDVIVPLRGEAALSVQARAVPLFTLVARTVGPATTREALARLQGPVARRLAGAGTELFQARGDGSFTLPLTARLQPSYGLTGDVLVATTAQPGLEQMRVAPRGIAQSPALARVLSEIDGRVQALGFFDLHALIDLVERTGLAAGSGSAAVRTDLEPIEATSAVATQDPDHPTDTTAELFLQIP